MKNNKEEKNMELWVKFLLALAGVGAVGMVAYGIVTYNTTKENEIKEAAASNPTIIKVNDSTSDNKSDIEQTVDYSLEAETAFSESGLPEECRDQFISVFIDYRKKGIQSEEIVEKLVAKYNEIVNQSVQANGASDDAEIETPEDEEYQRQLELEEAARQQAEATTEQPENSLPAEPTESKTPSTSDFDVLYLEEQELYAQSSVNIRSGAGINYEKVGSLSLNEAVTVDGLAVTTEGKEWYQLVDSEGSLIGYVSASYLGKEKVQETPAITTTNEKTQSNEQSTTETPKSNTSSDSGLNYGESTAPVGATTPSGATLGRGNINREATSGSQGGSGKGNNATYG